MASQNAEKLGSFRKTGCEKPFTGDDNAPMILARIRCSQSRRQGQHRRTGRDLRNEANYLNKNNGDCRRLRPPVQVLARAWGACVSAVAPKGKMAPGCEEPEAIPSRDGSLGGFTGGMAWASQQLAAGAKGATRPMRVKWGQRPHRRQSLSRAFRGRQTSPKSDYLYRTVRSANIVWTTWRHSAAS